MPKLAWINLVVKALKKLHNGFAVINKNLIDISAQLHQKRHFLNLAYKTIKKCVLKKHEKRKLGMKNEQWMFKSWSKIQDIHFSPCIF